MAFNFIAGYVAGTKAMSRAAGMQASAAQFSTNPTNRIYDLDERIDRLTMVMQAMWSLLEEQGMSAEQLEQRLEEMDAADGRVDGKVTPAATTCPECQAAVNPGAGKCQFCGTETGESSPFANI